MGISSREIKLNDVRTLLETGIFVTSSSVKQAAIGLVGLRYVDYDFLLRAVSQGEEPDGNQQFLIEDNNKEWPVVMDIAYRKALALQPYANRMRLNGIRERHTRLWVNDAVFSFRRDNGNGGFERTIVNKPKTNEDKSLLINFFKEQMGNFVYSKAANALVEYGYDRPVFLVATSLRFGTLDRIPKIEEINSSFSAGMNAMMAIKSGILKPSKDMKFEMRIYDFRNPNIVIQQNYELRIPYNGTEADLNLINKLSMGFVPEHLLSQLKLVKIRTHQKDIFLRHVSV